MPLHQPFICTGCFATGFDAFLSNWDQRRGNNDQTRAVYQSNFRRVVRFVTEGRCTLYGAQKWKVQNFVTSDLFEQFESALVAEGGKKSAAQPYGTVISGAFRFAPRCDHVGGTTALTPDDNGPSTMPSGATPPELPGDEGSEEVFEKPVFTFGRKSDPRKRSSSRDLDSVKEAILDLVTRAIEKYGDIPPHDGYQSTGLAAIDAVFAANAKYGGVLNIKKHLRPRLAPYFPNDEWLIGFDLHALISLHDFIANRSPGNDRGDLLADDLYRNRSVIGGHRKALVVEALAQKMKTAHLKVKGLPGPLNSIKDFDDLWQSPNRMELGKRLISFIQEVQGIGPATSRYFLLLVGGPYVKPDVWTMRWTSRVLGRTVGESETTTLLEAAISELITEHQWSYSVPRVEHLIWLFESGRLDL